jgi:hypothetical protein
VLPANCKADSAAIRNELGVRKTRFANREELWELTGLVPGSVPPFGRPIQGDCAILGDLLALGNSRLPSVDGQQVRPTLVGSQGAGACPKHNLFAFMITSLN